MPTLIICLFKHLSTPVSIFYLSVYTVRVSTLFICLIMHLCRVHPSVQLSVSTVLKHFPSNSSTSRLSSAIGFVWLYFVFLHLIIVYFYIEYFSDACLCPSFRLSIYKNPCISDCHSSRMSACCHA